MIHQMITTNRCVACGRTIEKMNEQLYFRGRYFCSGVCNNNHMHRLIYNRKIERSTFHFWNFREPRGRRVLVGIGDWEIGTELYIRGIINLGFMVDLGDDGDSHVALITLQIPFFSGYLFFDVPWKYKKDLFEERSTGFYWFDGSLVINLGYENTDSSKNHKWQHWYITPKDILLGRAICTTEYEGSGECEISMPEGIYKATYLFEKRTWTRKWWPFPFVRRSTWIEIPEGIPFAGKGENSYDCGDDALHGTGGEGYDVANAVKNVQNAVKESRDRYGLPSRDAFVSRDMMPINNQ